MEYFRIDTVEELKEAYNNLEWNPLQSLEEEISFFKKNKNCYACNWEGGCWFLFSNLHVKDDNVEIPNPFKKGKDNKYKVKCKGVDIDVYDVLKAFNVICPATQHAIKKLLKTGNRGHKNALEDLNDVIASVERAKELLTEPKTQKFNDIDLENAIEKAKPNLDKIENVDKHLKDIRQ